MICVAVGIEREVWVIDLSAGGRSATLQEPRMGVNCGTYLLAAGFVGGLQYCMANTKRYIQVWLDAPRVLNIVLKLVCFEVAGDKSAVIQQRPRCAMVGETVVENALCLGEPAHQVAVIDLIGVT